MVDTKIGSIDPSIEALADVFRIFAARGRVLREARARQKGIVVSEFDCSQMPSTDSAHPAEMGNAAQQQVYELTHT